MPTNLGEHIRDLRLKRGLLLRQVAAILQMDTALLSKIERGERTIKKELIPLLAKTINADNEELLMLFLADQVMDVLKNEKLAEETLKTVSKNIKKNK